MDTPRTEDEKKPTPQPRVRRVTAVDEWFDGIFEWISENSAWTLGVLGVALAAGGIAAGTYEWQSHREESAQAALAAVERANAPALDPASTPANAQTARELREQALAGYETVRADHPDTIGAKLAQIRAASLEVQMERFEPADARLSDVLADLEEPPLLRAVALRLHGYVLERLDRAAEAGEAYAQAAAIESYPGRAGAFLQAAETFERLGDDERALALYEALTLQDSGFAERSGVVDRMQDLRGASPGVAPVAPPAGEGDASPEPAEGSEPPAASEGGSEPGASGSESASGEAAEPGGSSEPDADGEPDAGASAPDATGEPEVEATEETGDAAAPGEAQSGEPSTP